MGQHRDLFLRHKHLTANPAGSALRPANGCAGRSNPCQSANGVGKGRNHFTGLNFVTAHSAYNAIRSSFPEAHGINSMNLFGGMFQLGNHILAE